MVIGLFGESCTGKSAVADALKAALAADVYTGRDYLRMDKQEALARRKFQAFLADKAGAAEAVVYVASEKEQLSLLPDSCFRVLMTADLALIQERFSRRTGGVLPPPVAAMLERRHGAFDAEPCDLHVVSGQQSVEEICASILAACGR